MRTLLITLLLTFTQLAVAQVDHFATTESKIADLVKQNQWNEVLVLAPDLIIKHPGKGEGHYYTSLALFNLGQEQKALKHLTKSEELADAALATRVSQLKQAMNDRKQKPDVLKGNIEKGADYSEVAMERYEEAMEAGKVSYQYNDFHKAISDFNKALSYKPNDQEATYYRALAMDELVWLDVKKADTIDAYEQYLAGESIRSYTDEAIETIQKKLISYGDKFASENDVIQMENYLNKYLAVYPDGPDAATAKKILCKVYFKNAKTAAIKHTYESQTEALDLFLKVNQLCPEDYALDTDIRTAQVLQTRYGRPDRFFFGLVHDKVSTFGMTYGTINTTGVGLYFTARADAEIFKYGSYFTVNESGEVTDEVYGDVHFTGKTSPGNTEGVLGITKKLSYPIWIYAGGGAAYNPVYWEADVFNGTGSGKRTTEWARNTDETTWTPVFDAGVIADVKGFNMRAGVKTHDFSAWNLTLGIGFSVKR